MDDNDSNERYFNSLVTQRHHSDYNAYDIITPPDEDCSSTDSENSVRVTVIDNCKCFPCIIKFNSYSYFVFVFY